MPETPNHEYNVPNAGDENWHVPLNENFEQFDTDVEIRVPSGDPDDYEPKAGAKFMDPDTGNVYVGDGNTWNFVPTTGRSPELVSVETASLGVGTTPVPTTEITARKSAGRDPVVDVETAAGDAAAKAIHAEASSSSGNTFGVYSRANSPDGTAVYARNDATSGGGTGVVGTSRSPDGIGVHARNVDGGNALQTDGHCLVDGDLDVTGAKNFTQTVDTDGGEKEVVYTATEAPTARTEVSGVAELEAGRADVPLPEHFGWVTSDDADLVVETTPYSADSGGLAVVERSTERVVVADLDGDGDYAFSYTVKGIRDGHADKQVVREPSATEGTGCPSPAPADD